MRQTFTIPKNNLYFFQRLLVLLCVLTFVQIVAPQTAFCYPTGKRLDNTVIKQNTINGLGNIVLSVYAINNVLYVVTDAGLANPVNTQALSIKTTTNELANKVVVGKFMVDGTDHLTKNQKLDTPNNSLFDAFLQIKPPAGWVIILFWVGMWLMAPSMLMPKKK